MRKVYITIAALLLCAGTSIAQTKTGNNEDIHLQDSVLSFLIRVLPSLDDVLLVPAFQRSKSTDLFYSQDVAPNYDLSIAIEDVTKEINLQKLPTKKWTKAVKIHPLTEQKLQPKADDMIISIQKPIYRDGMYYVMATLELKLANPTYDFLFIYDKKTLINVKHTEYMEER